MPIPVSIFSEVIDHPTGTSPVRLWINLKFRKIPESVTLESVLFYGIKKKVVGAPRRFRAESSLWGTRDKLTVGEKREKRKSQGTCVVCQNRFLMVPLIFTTCHFTNLYEPYKESI